MISVMLGNEIEKWKMSKEEQVKNKVKWIDRVWNMPLYYKAEIYI